ncbi:UbiH/UbiF/VisC/COQ6 family ubiquinone biosynthesis hydroxylase [Bermanella sp. R86510]|uniref:UbiH/UbiF/VisC/COQ6 family ubiquinone biosynthesis hydroxylase n=1 Tax=unclassified Bermanella TaxID=2627862 RepID=UPI0037C682BA
MQFDVIIVGGGMVGSALAAALSQGSPTKQNMRIALLEPAPAQADASPVTQVNDVDQRVSAINRANQSFLQDIGAWQHVPAHRLSAYDKMRVWDGIGTGHIQFDAMELAESHLGHIVENRFIAHGLIQSVREQNCVNLIEQGVSSIEQYDEQLYCVQLESGELLLSPMIVAADGARSMVRQWAEFETREWDYDHHGLVCTVRTQYSHENCAWQRFTGSGVLAFLPLAEDSEGQSNLCSIVYSCPPQEAEALLALDDEAFKQRLAMDFEQQLGEVIEVGKRNAIPLRQRHSKSYIKKGLVLVGDAAHTIHPLAGQGVNLGLQDAKVLAQMMLKAHSRGLELHHAHYLARYERQRMLDNLTMMAAMEGFKRTFTSQQASLTWLRNWGMNKINQLPAIKHHLMQQAMGLK